MGKTPSGSMNKAIYTHKRTNPLPNIFTHGNRSNEKDTGKELRQEGESKPESNET